jgi:predicted transcriptional regulator of viral defense system
MQQRWTERKNNQKPNRAVESGQRQQVLLSAVRRLHAATIEDVAKATGFDQRGIAGSFYYLVKNGQLKRAQDGKYTLGSAQRPSGRSTQRRQAA